MGLVSMLGTASLLKSLKQLGEDYDKRAKKAGLAGALIVQKAAKQNIKDKKIWVTGNLYGSISVGPPEAVEGGWVYRVGTNVVYAPPHEFGYKGLKARPYIRPALDENRENIKSTMIKILKED